MKRITPLARAGALMLATSIGLSAQTPSNFSFKMGGGPLGGKAKHALGDSGFVLGADVEYSQKLSEQSALVYGFGYRYLPGDNQLLSYIPFSIAATNINPSYYETRNRKTEGQDFHFGALYRWDAWMEGVYFQGGLRLARTKVQAVDTGTQITTNGLAIANTTTTTPSANILAINSIASKLEKSSTNFSPVLGIGYRFAGKYAMELNLANVTVAIPIDTSKSGISAEFSFSVTF